MATSGPSLSFSRAQAAFNAALRTEIAARKLRGVIDPGMGPIMFTLEQRGTATMSELAAAAGVAPSTMTGIAARMKQRGLVRTADDPRDRRGTVVALTARGRSMLPNVRRIEKNLDDAFRRVLDDEEIATLSRLLDRLATSLPDEGS